MMNDDLCVVHARAAGLDVHKGHITATVRLCATAAGEPQCETRTFDALASGLRALVAWLTDHRVEAASMEATGVYWHTPLAGAHRGGHRGAVAARAARPATARTEDRRRGQPLAGAGVPVRTRKAEFRSVPAVPRPALPEPPSAEAGRSTQPGAQPSPEGDRPRRRPHRCSADRHLRQERSAHSRRPGRPAEQHGHPRLAQFARPPQARSTRRCSEPGTTRYRAPPARRPAGRTRRPHPGACTPSTGISTTSSRPTRTRAACWRPSPASTTRRPAPS